MLESTIAGNLPKPDWLAEPEKLWAPNGANMKKFSPL